MARNEIVPIDQLQRRSPEAGRIRLGVKGKTSSGKMKPESIKTFRFTSVHKDLIELLAAEHGGKVEPWDEPLAKYAHQWQVVSTTNQIRVYLPKNGLSQDYELWSRGGRARQCDGLQVETIQMQGENAVPIKSPCICAAKGVRECQMKTRMQVVIPNLPFLGTWRVETGSWNAAHELPGMFEMIAALQEGALVDALLGCEARTDRIEGRTRHYVVPTLGVNLSPIEIQAGMASVGALEMGRHPSNGKPIGQRPALELVQTNGNGADHANDDDIVDAEVIDAADDTELASKLRADAVHFNLDADQFVVAAIASGHAEKMHQDMIAGLVEPTGFSPSGKITWKQLTDDSTSGK